MKLMPILTIFFWIFFGTVAVIAWNAGLWPITAICVFCAAVCANSTILTMHEAVHFLLSDNKRVNDIAGIIGGTLTLAPMSLFRVVHTAHHGRIGTDSDLEFWPYVNKSSKRWHRVIAAVTELTFAPLYYLFMFIRALVKGQMSDRARRRCYRDVAIMVVALAGVLAVVAINGWWVEFLIAYLIPESLAANMQSWRRLTEHVGLYGDDALSLTRTILPTNPLERFYCAVMLNENYHAPHHQKANIKWVDLPDAAYRIRDEEPQLRHLFYTSYFKAFPHMLRELGDPRIGRQWLSDHEGDGLTNPSPSAATAS